MHGTPQRDYKLLRSIDAAVNQQGSLHPLSSFKTAFISISFLSNREKAVKHRFVNASCWWCGAALVRFPSTEAFNNTCVVPPPAGFEVWSRTVEAFVKQLCLQEQYLKAASHLLSVNKLYEAVDLLRSHKFYRSTLFPHFSSILFCHYCAFNTLSFLKRQST